MKVAKEFYNSMFDNLESKKNFICQKDVKKIVAIITEHAYPRAGQTFFNHFVFVEPVRHSTPRLQATEKKQHNLFGNYELVLKKSLDS